MPLFDYVCDRCGGEREVLQLGEEKSPECCEVPMRKKFSAPMVKIEGQGFPSRRKWMDNWTPDSPAFSTGSLHGERY
jgi:putative FmdB family regulatory protein